MSRPARVFRHFRAGGNLTVEYKDSHLRGNDADGVEIPPLEGGKAEISPCGRNDEIFLSFPPLKKLNKFPNIPQKIIFTD